MSLVTGEWTTVWWGQAEERRLQCGGTALSQLLDCAVNSRGSEPLGVYCFVAWTVFMPLRVWEPLTACGMTVYQLYTHYSLVHPLSGGRQCV